MSHNVIFFSYVFPICVKISCVLFLLNIFLYMHLSPVLVWFFHPKVRKDVEGFPKCLPCVPFHSSVKFLPLLVIHSSL